MLLCSSGAPTWNYISLCLVLGKQGFLGRNLRVEAALRARLTCWKLNSQPLLGAELGMSRERRVHVFREQGRAGRGRDKSSICLMEQVEKCSPDGCRD